MPVSKTFTTTTAYIIESLRTATSLAIGLFIQSITSEGTGSDRSTAFRRSCRQLATQECSNRPKRRSIAVFEQLFAIKRKRAHVGRDQTSVDASTLMSPCVERQLVATGRNSRTRSTPRNSTPTRRRSVASDPATVAARRR